MTIPVARQSRDFVELFKLERHAFAAKIRLARAVLGYATWTVVAAVLIMRATLGWRGRLAAFGTLAGVALLTLVLVIYAMRPLLGGGA